MAHPGSGSVTHLEIKNDSQCLSSRVASPHLACHAAGGRRQRAGSQGARPEACGCLIILLRSAEVKHQLAGIGGAMQAPKWRGATVWLCALLLGAALPARAAGSDPGAWCARGGAAPPPPPLGPGRHETGGAAPARCCLRKRLHRPCLRLLCLQAPLSFKRCGWWVAPRPARAASSCRCVGRPLRHRRRRAGCMPPQQLAVQVPPGPARLNPRPLPFPPPSPTHRWTAPGAPSASRAMPTT